MPEGSAIVLDVQEVRLENQDEEVSDASVQGDRLEDQDDEVGQREKKREVSRPQSRCAIAGSRGPILQLAQLICGLEPNERLERAAQHSTTTQASGAVLFRAAKLNR